MAEVLDSCFRIYTELETQRADTLADLKTWSPERVCFRSSPGAWSAVDVLDHIVKAETGTVADVRVGLRNPQHLGVESRPGIAALDRALRSEQLFQVPPGAAIHPDSETTLPEVCCRWEQTRTELKHLLQELAPGDACGGVFCHPFAGWMTVGEVLSHFSAHLFHHGFQLARLRASSGHLHSGY